MKRPKHRGGVREVLARVICYSGACDFLPDLDQASSAFLAYGREACSDCRGALPAKEGWGS